MRIFVLLVGLWLIAPLPGALGASPAQGTVSGRVVCKEGEACRGVAVLWRDCAGLAGVPLEKFAAPGISAGLSEDGSFVLTAAPGLYCVGAVVRTTAGPEMGPPRLGDLIYMTPGPQGELLEVEVEAGQGLDLGWQRKGWRYESSGLTGEAPQGPSLEQVLD